MLKKHAWWRLMALVVVTGLLAAACGDDDDDAADGAGDGSTEETSASTDDSGTGDPVGEAQAAVDEYYANFNVGPPTEGPASVLEGTKIFYLSAGTSSPSGTAGVAAVTEVGELLGAEVTIFDGQFSPAVYQDGIRQAVAQQADALLLYGVDCPGNEAALQEARDAGVQIVGLASVDCGEANPGEENLFDAQPLYPLPDGEGTGYEVWRAYGVSQAEYIVATVGAEARVIQFAVPDFLVTAAVQDGLESRLAELCPTCEIVETVVVTVEDFGTGLQEKADQALLQHPEANAVAISYDDLVTLGINTAVVNAGRQDMVVVAGTGYPTTMDLIRENQGVTAGFVQEHTWDHYAGMDAVNRLLAGEPPAATSFPVIWYDLEHNMPAEGGFVAGVDFAAAFEQVWNAAG